MGEVVPVAKRSDLRTDTGCTVEVKGRLIALFLYDSKVYAIDDSCPHMGGPLGEGIVCDGVVTCPWHAWRFRVTDGVWVNAPNTKVQTYSVTENGDDVLLEVNW